MSAFVWLVLVLVLAALYTLPPCTTCDGVSSPPTPPPTTPTGSGTLPPCTARNGWLVVHVDVSRLP
eukprot:1161402-Prorocentrum_minimum.AAC.1